MLNQQYKMQLLIDLFEPFLDSLELELGVCMNNMIAIAGTGIFRQNVGTYRPDTILAEVLKKGKPIVLEDKTQSNICLKCANKTNCRYRGVIYSPIKNQDSVCGIIYIMSKKKLGNNANLCNDFLNKVTMLIQQLHILENNSGGHEVLLSTLINLIEESIIMVDLNGIIYNMNTQAERLFKLNVNNTNDYVNKYNIKSLLPQIKLNSNNTEYNYNSKMVNILSVNNQGYILKIKDNATEQEICVNGDPFKKIIGKSNSIDEVITQAKLISNTNCPVLIRGETGTGKELFAAAIHESSYRGKKPLVSLNCSAIPENLLESELFGYVKGAFSGANVEGKKGKFDFADKNTLFLDEIGDMPLHLQAKILRAIETNSIDRVGDPSSKNVDVRIIAATNRDIEKMVEEGAFRQDLYYRLNVLSLDIPALRERKGDIPLLIDYFLNRLNLQYKKQLRLDSSLIDLFMDYPWPGNIRELKNVLEYSATIERTNTITFSSLPKWFKYNTLNNQNIKNIHKGTGMKLVEREIIERVLDVYGDTTQGKIEAAKYLGMSLATLYRKIKYYDCTANTPE